MQVGASLSLPPTPLASYKFGEQVTTFQSLSFTCETTKFQLSRKKKMCTGCLRGTGDPSPINLHSQERTQEGGIINFSLDKNSTDKKISLFKLS